MFDAQDGEWLAVDVDIDEVDALVAAYDAEAFVATGVVEEPEDLGDDELEWVDADGYDYQPDSWVGYSCSSADWGIVSYHRSGSDDRLRQTSLSTRQQSSAMVLTTRGSTQGLCSGVWLDSDSLLTAAHCVWDESTDLPVTNDNVQVCTRGNAYSGAYCISTTAGVESVRVGPDYGGGYDPSDDYAIINIYPSALVGISHTSMYLSSAADSVVTAYEMHNIAHPIHSPPSTSCADNSATPISSYSDVSFALSHALGDISAPIYTSTFHFNHDGGQGHSGSPIYYCGDAWCDTGESGYVVSVWSGYNGVYQTHVGPKVRSFRTWALSQM